ncbi:hypothetical protein OH492_01410 [Vibrio chagasii]|nr:hypothetical protein [Vibrio chagasii]
MRKRLPKWHVNMFQLPIDLRDVSGYGEHFEQTIQAFSCGYGGSALTLSEVARYECKRTALARHACATPPNQQPSCLASVPQEQQGALVFNLRDSVTLFDSVMLHNSLNTLSTNSNWKV